MNEIERYKLNSATREDLYRKVMKGFEDMKVSLKDLKEGFYKGGYRGYYDDGYADGYENAMNHAKNIIDNIFD